MRDLAILQFVSAAMQREEAVILLVVVDHSSGSPGRQGFKMVVSASGQRCGTIGGGIMEFRLVEDARRLLARGGNEVRWLPQLHTKTARRWRSGMICAGGQIVVMCPLTAERRPEIDQALAALADGQAVALQLEGGKGLTLVRGGLAREVVKYSYCDDRSGSWCYQERLGPEFYVHVVGAGHVGLALSRVLATLDAHVSIFDHRGDLDTLHANTYAHRSIVGPYEGMASYVRQGPLSYVAIVSTSFKTDEAALRQVIGMDLAYLGVMGSQAKIRHLLGVLAAEGIAPALCERVRAPIGLPIHSRTTEEIAISIAGEMIQVKNEREHPKALLAAAHQSASQPSH